MLAVCSSHSSFYILNMFGQPSFRHVKAFQELDPRAMFPTKCASPGIPLRSGTVGGASTAFYLPTGASISEKIGGIMINSKCIVHVQVDTYTKESGALSRCEECSEQAIRLF